MPGRKVMLEYHHTQFRRHCNSSLELTKLFRSGSFSIAHLKSAVFSYFENFIGFKLSLKKLSPAYNRTTVYGTNFYSKRYQIMASSLFSIPLLYCMINGWKWGSFAILFARFILALIALYRRSSLLISPVSCWTPSMYILVWAILVHCPDFSTAAWFSDCYNCISGSQYLGW